MFLKIYRKEKSSQRNQIIGKYVRETVKGTPSLHLKKKHKTCFNKRSWKRDELDKEYQIN